VRFHVETGTSPFSFSSWPSGFQINAGIAADVLIRLLHQLPGHQNASLQMLNACSSVRSLTIASAMIECPRLFGWPLTR
jgi:hypothetical protein